MTFPRVLTTAAACAIVAFPFSHRSQAAIFGDFQYTDKGTSITIDRHLNQGKVGPLTIPSTIDGKPVTEVGSDAFSDSALITSVTFGPGMARLGRLAFKDCSSLSEVQLPEGLTTIEDLCFYRSGLKTVHVPSTLTNASGAFFGSKLESATFASGRTVIPDYTFYGCTLLRSVPLPPTVTRVGLNAFEGCESLTKVQLPSGLEEIGDRAFARIPLLKEMTIPASVTSIGEQAFFRSGIREMKLPKGVNYLGKGVFQDCVSLEHVSLPKNLTELPPRAFSGCEKLESPLLPKNLVRIGGYAFASCRFPSITFPPNIRQIEIQAFISCTNLRSAVFTGKAPALGNKVFTETAPDFTIFLEETAKGFTLPRWKGYRTAIPRPEITITSTDAKDVANGSSQKFPAEIIGQKNSYRNFTIHNTGIRPLTNLTASIQGSDSRDFVIKPLKPASLAPGKSVTIKVRFAPTQTSKRRAQLRIGSNDANESPYTIDLMGTGLREK